MRKFSAIALILCLSAVTPILNAQQNAATFSYESKYLVYFPKDYAQDTSQKWPLMIFLHGSGESGSDIEKVKMHGPPKMIAAGRQFPFIVVSPQAANSGQGFLPDIIKGLLDDLKKRYRVDPDRVYLTGLSMGGYATWEISQKFPEDFAAILPVCGGGEANKLWKLRYMPTWAFHGGKDDVVRPDESVKMIDSLKKYNPSAKLTIFPDANHNSWDTTYNTEAVYEWMFAQKRHLHKRISLPATKLNQFTGSYFLRKENDTLLMTVKDNKLFIRNHTAPIEELMEIIPSSDSSFFLKEDVLTELVFTKNKQGKVTGFKVYDRNELSYFRKLSRF